MCRYVASTHIIQERLHQLRLRCGHRLQIRCQDLSLPDNTRYGRRLHVPWQDLLPEHTTFGRHLFSLECSDPDARMLMQCLRLLCRHLRQMECEEVFLYPMFGGYRFNQYCFQRDRLRRRRYPCMGHRGRLRRDRIRRRR